MKTVVYKIIFFIFIIMFLINNYNNFENYKESFVPKKIKELYRPFHRNARMSYNNFYNNYASYTSNIFRKFGIL